MTEYKPDSWVMIKMTHKELTFYKVLGGWAGGYLHGSSWRLNSGVESCNYNIAEDRWEFKGASGSVYSCHPDDYGLKMSTAEIWAQMKERYPDQVELLENRDWSQMKW